MAARTPQTRWGVWCTMSAITADTAMLVAMAHSWFATGADAGGPPAVVQAACDEASAGVAKPRRRAADRSVSWACEHPHAPAALQTFTRRFCLPRVQTEPFEDHGCAHDGSPFPPVAARGRCRAGRTAEWLRGGTAAPLSTPAAGGRAGA